MKDEDPYTVCCFATVDNVKYLCLPGKNGMIDADEIEYYSGQNKRIEYECPPEPTADPDPANCMDISPTKISDCTVHEITDEEKKEFYGADVCCYQSITTKGNTQTTCTPFIKSNLNAYIQQFEESKEIGDIDNYTFKCESDPDPEPDSEPNSDYYSDSISLSFGLTFLFFGLLF